MNEFKPTINEEKITDRVNYIFNLIKILSKYDDLLLVEKIKRLLIEYWLLGLIPTDLLDQAYDALNKNKEIALEEATQEENNK
jgi:hypothetical protein